MINPLLPTFAWYNQNKEFNVANKNEGYLTSVKERRSYYMFFLGQNLIWGLIGYISTFLTDLGINAAKAAVILMAPKIWDAVNDTIFGYIVDRHSFKDGRKFIPWVKIGTAAVGITAILIFIIPPSLSEISKILWFIAAYLLFDAAYTVLDTPAFAVTTVMTSKIHERTKIISGGKLWAMVGGTLATVLIPMLQSKMGKAFPKVGGWGATSVVFVIISIPLMIPMLFNVKERRSAKATSVENPSFKQMLTYLKHNKYLIVVLLALLVLGLSSVEQIMSIYVARICLNNQSMGTVVGACVALSVIVSSAIIPSLAKKWDKFNVLITGLVFSILMDILAYVVGYENLILAILFIMLKCVGLAFFQIIIYMLIADTVEYGTYKSGTRAAGITFSLQCFVAKMKNALVNSVVLGSLAIFGFVSGENAVQPEGVAHGVWTVFCLLPAIGFAVAVVILLIFYKLRDRHVQIMSKYNNGEITLQEVESALSLQFGSPHN